MFANLDILWPAATSDKHARWRYWLPIYCHIAHVAQHHEIPFGLQLLFIGITLKDADRSMLSTMITILKYHEATYGLQLNQHCSCKGAGCCTAIITMLIFSSRPWNVSWAAAISDQHASFKVRTNLPSLQWQTLAQSVHSAVCCAAGAMLQRRRLCLIMQLLLLDAAAAWIVVVAVLMMLAFLWRYDMLGKPAGLHCWLCCECVAGSQVCACHQAVCNQGTPFVSCTCVY